MIDVDVWADVRCPWCWIGLRRLQHASTLIDEPVRITRRSFLLEPQGPDSPGRPTAAVATDEWGMSAAQWDARRRHIESEANAEGLRINVDGALMFDSRAVHRLLKLATETTTHQTMPWDATFAAHFEHNQDLGDPGVLARLASGWDLDGPAVRDALGGGRWAADVDRDRTEARRLGIGSVPTVVAGDGRRLVGNQPTDELVRFLGAAGSAR